MTTLVVRFTGERGSEFGWAHDFRNFAENVSRWMRDSGHGLVDLDEVDSGAPHFEVKGVAGSHRRRVIRWIEEEAERQRQPIAIDLK